MNSTHARKAVSVPKYFDSQLVKILFDGSFLILFTYTPAFSREIPQILIVLKIPKYLVKMQMIRQFLRNGCQPIVLFLP